MSADEMDRFFSLLQTQGEKLDKLSETQAAMNQRLEDTHGRLFGENGQPGILKYLADKDAELLTANNAVKERVGKLEKDRAWVLGAASAVGVAASFAASWFKNVFLSHA